MKSTKIDVAKRAVTTLDFKVKLAPDCWNYIKKVIDIVHEPILVLDKNLIVMAANEPFYRMFQVERAKTEGTLVYQLGNGQWDIPALRTLLENILPKNTFFKDFEVSHQFPLIGLKTMLLNARHIHSTGKERQAFLPPLIFLAIEDISPLMVIAETLAVHVRKLATKNALRTRKLEQHIIKLEHQIIETRTGSQLLN